MKISKIQIVSAVTWVATIISCSYILRGFENSQDIINVLIAGATIHFLLLSELANKLSKRKKIKDS